MSQFETWQIVLGVLALLVACVGPTILWTLHVRQDGRWQGRIEGKVDEIMSLMAVERQAGLQHREDAAREHDQIREVALGAHRKADRLLERFATNTGSGR